MLIVLFGYFVVLQSIKYISNFYSINDLILFNSICTLYSNTDFLLTLKVFSNKMEARYTLPHPDSSSTDLPKPHPQGLLVSYWLE